MKSQAKFLVEVKLEKDEDEHPEDDEIENLFKEFVEKTRALLPLKVKKVDVWIGMWSMESQFTLEFPPEFMRLVAENNWKVTFDLND
jgi:hypothetical protein